MGKPKRRQPALLNDLLYTSPVGMPTRAIAAALGASGYWVAEVSARDWTDTTNDEAAFWQVARALGYRDWGTIRPGTPPEALGPLGYPGKGVTGIVAPLDTARRPERGEDDLSILLRQKTPDFSPGDAWRSGSPCARLPLYRRACGNRRLWSGTDNQGSNARVSRSQRFPFG